ncbi:MAG: OmpA family protein [Pseudomonadota bacterium]
MTPTTWAKLGILCVAAAGSYGGALLSVDYIEDKNSSRVARLLEQQDLDWVTTRTDGMKVILMGTAPDEAAKYRAMAVASAATNPGNIQNFITVTPPETLPRPDFDINIMRTGDSILFSGIIPGDATTKAELVERIASLGTNIEVSDIVTTYSGPIPEGWVESSDLGLQAVAALEGVRVKVTPEKLQISGLLPPEKDKASWKRMITDQAPDTLEIEFALRQARQRQEPFSIRLVNEGGSIRMSRCVAETSADATRITDALDSVDGTAQGNCQLALGAPNADWARAAEVAIQSINAMGGGAITVTDEKVIVLPDGSKSQEKLAFVDETLRSGLPQGYEVAMLTTKSAALSDVGPTLSLSRHEDGAVVVRGPLNGAVNQAMFASVATAHLGYDNVTQFTPNQLDLPEGWTLRSLTAAEALAHLSHGEVEVTGTTVSVSGSLKRPTGEEDLAALLDSRLADSVTVLQVSYEAPLVVETGPSPTECQDRINVVLLENKITFASGKADLNGDGLQAVEAIAEILRECQDVPMEIQGHTDSSGNAAKNENLSTARAQSVLDALAQRRVLTAQLRAKGYGASQPIADNSTPEGREANRRIAFRLTSSEGVVQETVDGSE